jgi:hypothetical protein
VRSGRTGWTAWALAALLGAPAAAAPPPRRAGEVVRVERPRRRPPEGVRVCPITNPEARRMTCFGGTAPEPGARFTLVDEAGLRGSARARRVHPSSQDTCKVGSASEVELVGGQPGALEPRPTTGFPFTLAVQGVALSEEARVVFDPQLRPSGRDLEEVWVALDRDGDLEPDFAVTAFACAATVRELPIAPVGLQAAPYCVDYWARGAGGWARIARHMFYNCQ